MFMRKLFYYKNVNKKQTCQGSSFILSRNVPLNLDIANGHTFDLFLFLGSFVTFRHLNWFLSSRNVHLVLQIGQNTSLGIILCLSKNSRANALFCRAFWANSYSVNSQELQIFIIKRISQSLHSKMRQNNAQENWRENNTHKLQVRKRNCNIYYVMYVLEINFET